MKSLFPFFLILFTSCYSWERTTLTFVNKSSSEVDSIVISKPDRLVLGKLAIGRKYSKEVDSIELSSNEGVFPFSIYLRSRIINGSWGFHDFGMFGLKAETFYIFDNGIAYTNEPPQKPKEFKVYFYNASSESFDSIVNNNNAIIKVNEFSPRNYEVIYDYNKIETSKKFMVAIAGKERSSSIDHDFSNWNNNQIFFHFENDSLKKGSLPWREPLEFIVDIEVNLPFSSDSVRVESDALVKTYYFHQPNYLKIVFDFRKLKQSPVFTISALNKEYQIDLSSHDFSNIYSHQKIFFLEQKGIRSLAD